MGAGAGQCPRPPLGPQPSWPSQVLPTVQPPSHRWSEPWPQIPGPAPAGSMTLALSLSLSGGEPFQSSPESTSLAPFGDQPRTLRHGGGHSVLVWGRGSEVREPPLCAGSRARTGVASGVGESEGGGYKLCQDEWEQEDGECVCVCFLPLGAVCLSTLYERLCFLFCSVLL